MRSLSKSITVACIAFIMIMCAVLSYATYRIYTKSMYDRYRKQMASIVDYVEAHIDKDDMAECARTYEESDTYREFQAFFDDLIDHYSDVHYLYVMQATGDDRIPIRELCAANSTYEKENEPDMVLHLGDGEEDWFDAETAQKIWEIQQGDEDVYFVQPSEWGVDYTLARPLVDSEGNHYGLVCVDVSIDQLKATVNRNIYISIALIVAMGLLFTVLLLLWMRRNVTGPVRALEASVTELAGKSAGRTDPDELVFNAPDIRRDNEIKSLSDAVAKLTDDMRGYIKNVVDSEAEKKGLKAHVTEMNAIAYTDGLTGVRNRNAYERKEAALNDEFAVSLPEFGIVMVDLDDLKGINDRFGHDHGDEYIKGSCRIICDVFEHSPVYRVGGDEFVVLLRGRDYQNRDALMEELRKRFAESASDIDADPWLRYSATAGMTVVQEGDADTDAVLKRADGEMYRAKGERRRHRTISEIELAQEDNE